MSDLDLLRPEAREILDKIRKCVLRCEPSLDPSLATVCAELRRLTTENITLRDNRFLLEREIENLRRELDAMEAKRD